jgi:formate hydrogenlyase regulatory protein HycA
LEVDGTLFGLVRECHGEYPEGEERDDWAEFYPNRLGFSAPWDGSYDT